MEMSRRDLLAGAGRMGTIDLREADRDDAELAVDHLHVGTDAGRGRIREQRLVGLGRQERPADAMRGRREEAIELGLGLRERHHDRQVVHLCAGSGAHAVGLTAIVGCIDALEIVGLADCLVGTCREVEYRRRQESENDRFHDARDVHPRYQQVRPSPPPLRRRRQLEWPAAARGRTTAVARSPGHMPP